MTPCIYGFEFFRFYNLICFIPGFRGGRGGGMPGGQFGSPRGGSGGGPMRGRGGRGGFGSR